MLTIRGLARPFAHPILQGMRHLRRRYHIRARRNRLKKAGAALRARNESIKVVIGSGGIDLEGWLCTDLPVLDALQAVDWARLFPPGSVDRVLAEHVFEHWTEAQFHTFLRVVGPFLSPRGVVRAAVPDGLHPDSAYIDYVRPGGSGPGADDHKVLYTYLSLSRALSDAGYDYRLLEYFDEQGQFQRVEWDVADGLIHRSAEHDRRNQARPLAYTSLIVDFWLRA